MYSYGEILGYSEVNVNSPFTALQPYRPTKKYNIGWKQLRSWSQHNVTSAFLGPRRWH
eukprot:m.22335 g.22335  ORF g.22335 m.22335 type:complete len:58 (-) comp9287_c0_seq1:407-580(-)